MTNEQFESLLVSKGLVSSAKITVTFGAAPRGGVVFSMERVGHPATKREAAYLLSDDASINAAVDAMAAAMPALEAATEESFAAIRRRHH